MSAKKLKKPKIYAFPDALYVTVDQQDDDTPCILASEDYISETDGTRVAIYKLVTIKIVRVGHRLEDK